MADIVDERFQPGLDILDSRFVSPVTLGGKVDDVPRFGCFYAFDLVWLDDRDLRGLALVGTSAILWAW